MPIHETGDCLKQMWHRELNGLSGRASDLYFQGLGFVQFLKFLTNLTNLLSRNLGKLEHTIPFHPLFLVPYITVINPDGVLSQ